jgi:carboxyl-terminal processing protease
MTAPIRAPEVHALRSPRPQDAFLKLAGRTGISLAFGLVLAVTAASSPDVTTRPRSVAGSGDRTPAEQRFALSRRLAEMVEAVQAHEIGSDTSSTELVEGAIRGMLDTLDPHTHFLDKESYRTMREGQDGSFYGLGIIISVRRDDEGKQRLTVISPIDGMPAKKLGIRPGDIIAAINGEDTDDLSLDGAVAKLRGDKGTSVTITIERGKEKFDLAVERAEIPTESIQHAYMIRPDTGFIRIKDFTKTTTTELRQSIHDLRGQGMKKLVLDLRDNPGGLLDESVSVASTFLEPGQLVVETRGRIQGSNEKRFTQTDGERLPSDVPLIVLVNRGSASASEIVSGAIQDHDRGLLVGGTTWGKGLVQSVYSLSGDTGLALTTARYYTPSGRQIQRDYRSSVIDYYYGPRKNAPHGESHETEGGREVYSGGGIQPDVEVDEPEIEPIVARLIGTSAFFRFANQVHAVKHAGEVKQGYALTKQDVDEFRAFLAQQKIEIDDAEWTEALGSIRTQLQYEIVNAQLGLQEGFKVLNDQDPQVQAALRLWDRATRQALLEAAKLHGPELGPKSDDSAESVRR